MYVPFSPTGGSPFLDAGVVALGQACEGREVLVYVHAGAAAGVLGFLQGKPKRLNSSSDRRRRRGYDNSQSVGASRRGFGNTRRSKIRWSTIHLDSRSFGESAQFGVHAPVQFQATHQGRGLAGFRGEDISRRSSTSPLWESSGRPPCGSLPSGILLIAPLRELSGRPPCSSCRSGAISPSWVWFGRRPCSSCGSGLDSISPSRELLGLPLSSCYGSDISWTLH